MGESNLHLEFTVIDSSVCVWRTPGAWLHGKSTHAWCQLKARADFLLQKQKQIN